MPTNDNHQRLPSFIAIGPPRTGSTWLHEVLEDHADLPRHNKETRFFCTNFAKGVPWYLRHFDPASELVRGEVCPTYFSSPAAREQIAELIPNVKVICCFREPVGRIYSLYKVKRAFARLDWTFEEALARDPELMESARYAHYLAEWRRRIGSSNVLVVFYDDLVSDPQNYINEITEFAGIRRFALDERRLNRVHSSDSMSNPRFPYLTAFAAETADWLKEHHFERFVAAVKSSKASAMLLGGGDRMPPLSTVTADSLRASLRPEIEALEALLNHDLSSWKAAAR
jgi:hypothetical protein